MEPKQPPLFQPPRTGGRPPRASMSYAQFVDGTVETIRAYRARGLYPTREQVARAIGVEVSTFDRYRLRYDAFRDWSETVRDYDQIQSIEPVELRAEDQPDVPESEGPRETIEFLQRDEQFDPDDPGLMMIVVRSGDQTIMGANWAACTALGYSLAEMKGALYSAFMRPGEPTLLDGRPELHRAIASLMDGDGSRLVHYLDHWMTKRGERLELDATVQWISDMRTWCVRARRAGEPRAARGPEEIAFILVEEGGVIAGVNEATCRLLGYSRTEMVGALYESMVRPGQPPVHETNPESIRLGAQLRDGEVRWAVATARWMTREGRWLTMECQSQWVAASRGWAMRCRVRQEHGAEGDHEHKRWLRADEWARATHSLAALLLALLILAVDADGDGIIDYFEFAAHWILGMVGTCPGGGLPL